ncbi:DUF397 domain-containing protein [Streptomyces sp. NPDC001348]
MSTLSEPGWFKSSYSGGEGDNCLEISLRVEAVHIRDSKDKAIRPVVVTRSAWAAFMALAAGSTPAG